MGKKAIIIGAGPAGLTAAYELLKRTDITPVILEKSAQIGGISKTIEYKGNRMDIGGHRFFSKSDRVMNWWLNIMPLQSNEARIDITYHNQTRELLNTGTGGGMLIRKRLSRIYFLRKFFSYPVQLSFDTLRKLGVATTIKILASYCYAQLFPNKPEKSLQDFLINRFGKTLYKLFFKDYTEKVWGVPCKEIPAGWGAQRIKGVSVSKAIAHAATQLFARKNKDIAQKNTETSLIEQFLYPALGPGQLWDEVARQVVEMGGKIHFHQQVKTIATNGQQVTGITAKHTETGQETIYEGDYHFSTMPVQELIAGMGDMVPFEIKAIADGLQYRDFIIVGVLLKKDDALAANLKDTWIYIQERDVKAGRLQLFNNWSPYMVKSPDTIWMGMEYFCNKGDAFWQQSNEAIEQIAVEELEKMGLIRVEQVLDTTVHREEKTYPAYFGTYEQFDQLRAHVDEYKNLFLVGRNGMHKYNNSDHSMLTAMTAVDNIQAGVTSKENIWAINTEQEYHEEKKPVAPKKTSPLKWAAVAILAQFIIFKILYPFASFMPDSIGYIETALDNKAINVWPIGYSKFLQLFTFFSRSDRVLVFVQYLLLQTSALWFLFTLFRYVTVRPVVQYVLMAFFVLNPMFLIVSNYVSSDALFISISFVWAAQLLSLIYQPRKGVLIAHVLVLYLAFVVRFNSLYYPLISAVVILASSLRLKTKLVAIGSSLLLILAFSWYTSNQYRSLTGEKQFAAFAGWQLAGNALYAYSHGGKKIELDRVPHQLTTLHAIVNNHIDSLSKLRVRPDNNPGTYYQWQGPLAEYFREIFPTDKNLTNFQHYALMGPMFEAYGKYLIAEQPAVYAQWFVLPNLGRYYAPPAEFLAQYNILNTVPKAAQRLFKYRDVRIANSHAQFSVMSFMPVLSAMINLLFVGSVVGLLLIGGLKRLKPLTPLLLLVTALWLSNMVFSVLASPIVLRYQLFTLSMILCVGVLLTEFIYNYDKENHPGSSKPVTDPVVRLRSYEQAAGVR